MARSQFAGADDDLAPPGPESNPAGAETPAPSTSLLRFRTPGHVSAVILSTGREIRAEDGILIAPADLSDDERRQIRRAGCVPT